ncbi:MAG TPA: right-handed parallel beta-helix repeat-containing protein [Chitinophagaceae bacterium]|nr:right-handed parallel beta-helix repeat-containing protein [Chitinophagaceae bacterium]
MKQPVIIFLFSLSLFSSYGQSFVIKSIRDFGAKADGRTNDQQAFEKAAAYFNKRGGRGRLIIPKGMYLVGLQDFTRVQNGKPAYYGHDVLHLTHVQNMEIVGKQGAVLRYADSLYFGAFDPGTGKIYPNQKYFVKYAYAAFIGHCIRIDSSEKVTIRNLELDGNNMGAILGGVYGDKGRQLPHYGVFVLNSRNVLVDNLYVHHFCLDGISVSNKSGNQQDLIVLKNCRFTYNSRQGLSWVGGNGLTARDCQFNHTGQGAFNSPPGAGVDIEAEAGPIRNGVFTGCSFVDNKGVGLVADNGNSASCRFTNCSFWGTEAYAIWVNKPSFTFQDCKIYGSFVHGYNASADTEATRFISCFFEDKPYEGRQPYGRFLVESNGRKRVSFTNCRFVSNKMKLLWIQIDAKLAPEEKYQFRDCQFTINNDNLPKNDFVAVVRGMRYEDCTFEYTRTAAKEKHYYLNSCCANFNVDAGGNTIIYKH